MPARFYGLRHCFCLFSVHKCRVNTWEILVNCCRLIVAYLAKLSFNIDEVV